VRTEIRIQVCSQRVNRSRTSICPDFCLILRLNPGILKLDFKIPGSTMFKREIEAELKDLARGYPVVTITGPRQSGKTTLVQKVFPDKPYINLENPDNRAIAIADPRSFLDLYPNGLILDEIHQAPLLLSYIQGIVDDNQDKKGMYILTGSHQLEIHEAITQSLAGRTALLTLLPMSLQELKAANFEMSLDEALLSGGYPRVFNDKLNPTKVYRNYLQTYVERDLRKLINVKDLSQFQRFMHLCAGRIGQILNLESLGNDVGASSHTIKHWISILEASYIIIRLQPCYENFGKRAVKAPKFYFTDVGFATYLLGIEDIYQIQRDPLRGHLFENLVLLELIKRQINLGLDPHLFYFRDAHGNEVDLIYQKGRSLIPIEIKSSKTYNSSFLKGLRYFQRLAGDQSEHGYVIYAGQLEQKINEFSLIHYDHLSQIFD
jgi:predicted AAA+ superfamily ATPase